MVDETSSGMETRPVAPPSPSCDHPGSLVEKVVYEVSSHVCGEPLERERHGYLPSAYRCNRPKGHSSLESHEWNSGREPQKAEPPRGDRSTTRNPFLNFGPVNLGVTDRIAVLEREKAEISAQLIATAARLEEAERQVRAYEKECARARANERAACDAIRPALVDRDDWKTLADSRLAERNQFVVLLDKARKESEESLGNLRGALIEVNSERDGAKAAVVTLQRELQGFKGQVEKLKAENRALCAAKPEPYYGEPAWLKVALAAWPIDTTNLSVLSDMALFEVSRRCAKFGELIAPVMTEVFRRNDALSQTIAKTTK